MRTLWMACLVLALIGSGDGLRAEEAAPCPLCGRVIASIGFEGNQRTLPRILRRELSIAEGEVLTEEALADSRQAILDLNLFEEVETVLATTADGHVDLVFRVDEKRFWVLAPRVTVGKGRGTSLGFRLRLHNLGGLNQSWSMVVKRREFDDPDRAPERKIGFSYRIPRINDSRFDLDLGLQLSDRGGIERDLLGTELSRFTEDHIGTSMRLSRWLGEGRTEHGWRVGGGLALRRWRGELQSGTMIRAPRVKQIGASLDLGYRDMHHHVWSDSGQEFGYLIEQGVAGSSQNYTTQEIWYRGLWSLESAPHRTFYLTGGIGQSRGNDPLFVVFPNNTPDLRGVLDGVDQGDTYQYARAGYLHPVFGGQKWRAEIFTDYGEYYYTDGLQPTLGPPEVEPSVSFGLGLRYRFRSFVQFEFGFGVAYVPETGETVLWGTSKRIN